MPQIDLSWLQVDLWLIILGTIGATIFLIVSIIWGIRAHRQRVSAGREEMVGKVAEVRIALTPKGTVFVEGEQWTAISETDRVESGEEVTISKVDGLKLYVTKKR